MSWRSSTVQCPHGPPLIPRLRRLGVSQGDSLGTMHSDCRADGGKGAELSAAVYSLATLAVRIIDLSQVLLYLTSSSSVSSTLELVRYQACSLVDRNDKEHNLQRSGLTPRKREK
jgi:hypothetical protein